MNRTIALVALLLALLSGSVHAQCGADSLLYKLALQAEHQQTFGEKCDYFTIDYRPSYPYILGFDPAKNAIDTIAYQQLLSISNALDTISHTQRLNSLYKGDKEVKILNKESYKKFIAKNFWKKFWKTYPNGNGQTFVSGIGYNESCTEAVFYFEVVSQWLVGGGYFASCKFENGKWVVRKIIGVLQM